MADWTNALAGFSAGIQGQLPQFLQQQQQAQTAQKAEQRQSRVDEQERRKTYYTDADAMLKMLNSGNLEGVKMVGLQRLQGLSQLAQEDPSIDSSDTQRLMQLTAAAGNGSREAQELLKAELETAVDLGKSIGVIQMPKAEIIPQSAISATGQVGMMGADGRPTMQNLQGFQPAPTQQESKVVGDYLVDSASGDILFDAASRGGQGGGEHGLTPLVFRDPNTGGYSAYLPTKAGTMTQLPNPDGLEFVPDSGRLGYNPANIQERGMAEANTQLQAAPVIGEAERAQSLAASQGQRGGALATKEDQFRLLDDVIEQVKQQSGAFTTGMAGSVARRIPGTEAADMAANLDTLLATAGFERLQDMRDNSPTGGALGSVTERELALLQATWGSIQQSQSKEQFDRNLDRFQKQVKDSWTRVEDAYARDYGGQPASQPAAAPSSQARRRYNPETGRIE